MRLDVSCMRYLSKDDYRVLVAVEMGMRNHEMVPVNLITSIAQLRYGGSYRILSTLLRHKLVAHALQEYDGYRLSYLGYDILALHTLQARGIISSVGNQIGVGKESDIFEAMDAEGNELVIKIHRLGRTSFRAVRKQRDYMLGKSKASWLYMSRLAAVKEFAFMKALHVHGFPTPMPIDQNRHVVAMSRVSGFPMAQIRAGKLEYAGEIFARCLEILRRLAEHGLIHCDFNEFNLMIDEAHGENGGNITLIDFPQMVSTSHPNASELLQRDIQGLIKFFAMKMKYMPKDEELFTLEQVLGNSVSAVRIDEEVKASGFDEDEDDVEVEEGAEGAAPQLVEEGGESSDPMVSKQAAKEKKNIFDFDLVDMTGIASDEPAEESEAVDASGEREQAGGSGSEDEEDGESGSDGSSEEEEEGEDRETRKKHATKKKDSTKPKRSQEEKLADAHSKLRSEILRKGRRSHGKRGGGKSSGGAGGGSRNSTKQRNKYGHIVRNDDLRDY